MSSPIPVLVKFANSEREIEILMPQVPAKGERIVLHPDLDCLWRVTEVIWHVPAQNARVRAVIEVGF